MPRRKAQSASPEFSWPRPTAEALRLPGTPTECYRLGRSLVIWGTSGGRPLLRCREGIAYMQFNLSINARRDPRIQGG